MNVVGVIGAGTIGLSVAMDLIYFGYKVIVRECDQDACDSALIRLEKDHRLYAMNLPAVRKIPLDYLIENLLFTTDYGLFTQADFVIENISENFEEKEKVYEELKSVCKSDVIYGVNTSCISITRIGALLNDPSKVIGMHFMNPSPMKKIVEVIRGFHTSEETVQATMSLLKSMDKEGVLVNDYPGFVTNRVLMLTINECFFLLQDGVASALDIDKIFRKGFGHKMGPLTIADLIGLDTILQSLDVLYESYQDSKYRSSPYLRRLVDAGHLGRKTGKGVFDYAR